jgi:hypothetical protein
LEASIEILTHDFKKSEPTLAEHYGLISKEEHNEILEEKANERFKNETAQEYARYLKLKDKFEKKENNND